MAWLARGVAAALAIAAGASSASATVFDFSYSGAGIDASGVLDATSEGGGVYDVTSISGLRNGLVIVGLADYAGDDQKVYYPAVDLYGTGQASSVDYPGLSYETSDGALYNVYFDNSTTDSYQCGQVGLCETEAAGNFPVDSFTLSAPEPATWAMMLIGFGAMGGAMRLARRSKGEIVAAD